MNSDRGLEFVKPAHHRQMSKDKFKKQAYILRLIKSGHFMENCVCMRSMKNNNEPYKQNII
jgi:hypothetical protein